MKKRSNISEAKWQEVKAEIRDILIGVAKSGQLITYSELTAMLQTASIHYHSQVLVRLLTDIGMEEAAAGRPSLPSLVVSKQTGMPGAGYFYVDVGEEYIANPEAYWAEEVKRTHDYWSQN
jgi:hypothetical protein